MSGDLSATEQRILEGLAAGLHDAEIAVRAGLTVGDVKQRITAILQREHLLDRGALLAWYRGEPARERSLPADASGRPLRLRPWFVPAVAAAAFAGGLLVALAFTWPSGDSAAQAEPPDPTRAGGQEVFVVNTAVPSTVSGVTRFPLLVGNAVTIDAGFAPIVITYPDGADDERSVAVDRLSLDPTTRLVVSEPIWEQAEGQFLHTAIANDLGTLVAVHYNDGEGGAWVEVLTVGGELLSRDPAARDDELVTFMGPAAVMRRGSSLNPYYIPGDGGAFDAPGSGFGDPLGWIPGAGLTWYGGNGYVLDGEGAELFRLGAGVTHDLQPLGLGLLRDDGLATEARMVGTYNSISTPGYVSFDAGTVAVAWQTEPGERYTSLVSLRDGATLATYFAAFVPVGAASGPRMVVQNCDPNGFCPGNNRPAIYSFPDRRLSEVAGISDNRRLIGSQRGPFARVLPAEGCRPIRASLELRDETILWCAQPGEPLTLYDLAPVQSYYPGEPRILHSDGLLDYVRVLAPSGEPGWIRLDAVEIGPFPQPGP